MPVPRIDPCHEYINSLLPLKFPSFDEQRTSALFNCSYSHYQYLTACAANSVADAQAMSAFYRIPDSLAGLGFLVSLTPETGLISSLIPPSSSTFAYIFFDLKHFGDQAVTDLTSVLRIGFILKYQIAGTAGVNVDDYGHVKATFVAPASFDQLKCTSFYNSPHLVANLDAPNIENSTVDSDFAALLNEQSSSGPNNKPPKCIYNVDCESKALHFLMDIFRQTANLHCTLHTIHCIISNSGDPQLYHYIGSSSFKRRQFIEKRNHIFSLGTDDVVHLVPGALYLVVVALAREVLKRGGATFLQELFDAYLMWPDVPLESRELIGDSKQQFVRFLDAFPFVFAVFPSKVFVSVRRRLPDNFEYPTFLANSFGDQEGSPNWNHAACSHTLSTNSLLNNRVSCSKFQSLPPANGTIAEHGSQLNPAQQMVGELNSGFSPMWERSSDQWQFAQHFLGQPYFHHNVLPMPIGYCSTRESRGDRSSSSLSVISCISDNFQISNCSFNNGNYGAATNFPQPQAAPLSQCNPKPIGHVEESATPGFWKSYDLGTENLVKNLSTINLRYQSARSSTPPSACSSSGGSLFVQSPPKNVAQVQKSTQTVEAHCQFFCLRCGSAEIQLGQPPTTKSENETIFSAISRIDSVDSACQTDENIHD